MGLRPANCDENKGGAGGSACPERAREAERIAPGAGTHVSPPFANRVFSGAGNERHLSGDNCFP
jgi:hypothetical protein